MNVNRKSTRLVALFACAAAAMSLGAARVWAQDKEAEAPLDPGALLAELGGLAKEDKKLDDKLSQLKTERSALGPRIDNLKQRQENLNRRWEEGKAYCTGTFEEDEYRRRLARCNAMEKEMRAEQGQLDNQREAILADWQRIDDERAKATARKDALRARGAKIQSMLAGVVKFRGRGDACVKLFPLEAIHHCMQEIWDGAGAREGTVAGGDPNVVVVPNSDGRRRTAEQAIEEYKNSGAANPAPRRPTQREVPPPQN